MDEIEGEGEINGSTIDEILSRFNVKIKINKLDTLQTLLSLLKLSMFTRNGERQAKCWFIDAMTLLRLALCTLTHTHVLVLLSDSDKSEKIYIESRNTWVMCSVLS